MTDVIVIGGGAAGAAVFGELLRQHGPGTVHWVVGHAAPGRGVAYSTRDERHLLNVRASGMGLFHEHGDDFVRHAAASLGRAGEGDFLARSVFGDFVQAQVQARLDEARRAGRRYLVHAEGARALYPQADGGYAVELDSGWRVQVRQAALAIGTLPQRALRAVSAQALASGAYELDPWKLSMRLGEPRRVLVIGTGLTAVDMLLSAARRWPGAQLVAVSRHGRLPFAHTPLPSFRHLRQDALNQALLACDGVRPMLRRLREAATGAPGTDWRSLVDGMRPITARLWQRLSHAQRRQFLRHVRWLWEACRHRMAPATALAIEQLREEGRLQVHPARVLSVDGSGPLAVSVRDRGAQRIRTIESDLVVQATGLDTSVAFSTHGLLAQLLRDGLAVPDPLELGVQADGEGQLLDASGLPQHGLYAIGSLLRGTQWECTAMPEIRTAAHRLAGLMVQRSRRPQLVRSAAPRHV
ncbi:FAD/NAD(P)-binding protein [Frateuria sp.]|uniref:FAD/NAD(P)-binding protein n=1 Tax=Frateuria sp. TaxID=2211372 RepID=UPI00185A38D7|nr:FAD/NAD(P)-binding protein [Frateuria sp.]NUR21519.1 pyridine nucleotide-disulfide oxidoreductase [Frateuria sp.]